MEDNTASESISILATTYGRKSLQLYEYDANEYRYEAKWKRYSKNRS